MMWMWTLSGAIAGTAVAPAELPEATLAALEARWTGVVVLEVEREDSGEFEVELRVGADEVLEVEIDGTGTIFNVEVETGRSVALSDVPEPVKQAIEARWKGAQLLEAETEGPMIEVEIRTVTGIRWEAVLTPKGVIQSSAIDDD